MPIVHGDIKCANIFISDDGRIKLGDFGIMMDVSIRGADQQCFDSGLISSMIANKLHWMAPEVLQKKTLYNQPADVWSLGCTMVEMLTGSPPYKKFTTYDWITAYHSGLLTYDVQQLIPDLSDDLSDLLEQVFRRETLQQKLKSGSNQ
uniref:Protein kinase domain-containing protein n=1 Tax=Plectus sambesii TaxID=2011161 RepID=A0A914W8R9_9BILA